MSSKSHGQLPRLNRRNYQGNAVIHWTMAIEARATGWLTEDFHLAFRELLLHSAAREHLLCPAYCLMPDHIHLVWMGIRSTSDQLNGMKFLREYFNKLLARDKQRIYGLTSVATDPAFQLQHQGYDHIFRAEERKRGAFGKVCAYILENPVRRALVKKAELWPFCGAVVAGYPSLSPFQDDFWLRFWRIHDRLMEPQTST